MSARFVLISVFGLVTWCSSVRADASQKKDPEKENGQFNSQFTKSTPQPSAADQPHQTPTAQVSQEMEKLRAEHVELSNRLVLLEEKTDSQLTEMNARLTKVLEDTSMRSSNLQSENEALRAQLLALKKEAADTNSRLQKIAEVASGLKAENSSIHTRLRNMAAGAIQQQKKSQSQHAALVEKVHVLHMQFEDLLAANFSLHLLNKELTKQLKTQEDSLRQSDTDLLNIIKNQSQMVHFMATFTEQQITVPPGRVVFDHVYRNKGNGYNQTSGIFTAPYTGLYVFAATPFCDTACTIDWTFVFNDKYRPMVGKTNLGPKASSSFVVPWFLRAGETMSILNAQSVSLKGDYLTFFGGWLVKKTL